MRAFLLPLALLASACATPVSIPTASVPFAVQQAAENVWKLSCLWRVENIALGQCAPERKLTGATCFPVQIIGDEIVLMTAAHAVQPDSPAETLTSISIRSGEVSLMDGRVLQIHDSVDSALVAFKIGDHDIPVHEIDRRVPAFGERVYVAGYPGMAGRLFLGQGIITDPDVCSAPVYPGSSGGPVFDADGRVIAMVIRIGMGMNEPVQHTCFHLLMRDL